MSATRTLLSVALQSTKPSHVISLLGSHVGLLLDSFLRPVRAVWTRNTFSCPVAIYHWLYGVVCSWICSVRYPARSGYVGTRDPYATYPHPTRSFEHAMGSTLGLTPCSVRYPLLFFPYVAALCMYVKLYLTTLASVNYLAGLHAGPKLKR